MRVLSTLAIRAGLLVVTLPKCAKWLIGDSFLFRSEMCESRSPLRERGARAQRGRGEGSAARSSRHFPCSAVPRIFDRDAHTGKLVANAVSLGEILYLTGESPLLNQ